MMLANRLVQSTTPKFFTAYPEHVSLYQYQGCRVNPANYED